MRKIQYLQYLPHQSIKETRLVFQQAGGPANQPGIIDRIRGVATELLTCRVAEIEPEMQAQLANVTWVDRPDKKGNSVRYAIIPRQVPDPQNPGKTIIVNSEIDIYTFNIFMYQQQIAILQGKLQAPKARIRAYTTEIRKIEGYIKQQEATHQRHEIKVIGQRERLDKLLKEYREGLGTRFEKNDLEAVLLRQQIDEETRKLPDLKDKDAIYGGYAIDIDNPAAGKQHFPDIRDLLQQYKDRMKEVEDLEVEPLEDRIKCNQAQLDKAQKEWQQYQLYLRTP